MKILRHKFYRAPIKCPNCAEICTYRIPLGSRILGFGFVCKKCGCFGRARV